MPAVAVVLPLLPLQPEEDFELDGYIEARQMVSQEQRQLHDGIVTSIVSSGLDQQRAEAVWLHWVERRRSQVCLKVQLVVQHIKRFLVGDWTPIVAGVLRRPSRR